jgi:hypothetical protein
MKPITPIALTSAIIMSTLPGAARAVVRETGSAFASQDTYDFSYASVVLLVHGEMDAPLFFSSLTVAGGPTPTCEGSTMSDAHPARAVVGSTHPTLKRGKAI